jgi:hypothetical protein
LFWSGVGLFADGLAWRNLHDEELALLHELGVGRGEVVLHVDEVFVLTEERRRDDARGLLVDGVERRAARDEPVWVVLGDSSQARPAGSNW